MFSPCSKHLALAGRLTQMEDEEVDVEEEAEEEEEG